MCECEGGREVEVRPHVKVSVVLGRKEVCGLTDVFVGMNTL